MSTLALISDMFERQGSLWLDDKQLDFNTPSIRSAKRMRIRLRSTIDAHRLLTPIKRHDNTGWPPTNSEIHNVDAPAKIWLGIFVVITLASTLH